MAEKKEGHVAKKVKDWSAGKYEDSLRAAADAEALQRGLPPVGHVRFDSSFREFVDSLFPLLNNGNQFVWHKHNQVIADVLQEVADGKRTRVMFWMPPRTGKSTLVSQYFSAYCLARHPDRWIGLASYNQDQADLLSKIAKRAYSAIYKLHSDSTANSFWESGKGGGMWASGVDGAQLGRGYSLGIIDDPLKSDQLIESSATMERLYRWYDGTFSTRQNLYAEVPAAIVVVHQRLSDYDLSGWLLARPVSEPWHVVSCEAIKDDDPPLLPANCSLEPDWRSPGEYLIPATNDGGIFKDIVDRQRESAPFVFYSEYQQRPTKGHGERVNGDDFVLIPADRVPKLKYIVRAWDTQVSKTSRDWSVGVLLGIDSENSMYILDVVRFRGDATEVYERIVQTALTDGDDVAIAVEEAAISKQTVQELKKEQRLGRFEFKPIKVDASKGNLDRRSAALFSRIKNRQVFLVEARWNPLLVQEFVKFTGSRNDTDDIISACTIGMSATYSRRGTTTEETKPPYLSPAWCEMKRQEEESVRQVGLW